MANGTLTTTATNAQYKKYTYAYAGTSYPNIHVFTTISGQGVAPAIAPSVLNVRPLLENVNPQTIPASAVIAKTNACMHTYNNPNEFFGFFYQTPSSSSYPSMYVDGVSYNRTDFIPSGSYLYTDPKYYPSFCIKTDGTATIRWFSSKASLDTALPYCKYIIGSCHPLVFNSKCVFNENVYDGESSGSRLLYNATNPDNQSNARMNINIDKMDNVYRTLLGHKSNGTFVMVSTDSAISIKAAANLIQDLGCDYAVDMDGSSPVQMRIKANYGPAGQVTTKTAAKNVNTAVCAYVI